MKKTEFLEIVESTYPNTASAFGQMVMVIPVTDNLLKVIDKGIESLKKEVEEE